MIDLTDILDRLIQAEVDFVLIGGLAAVAHGSSTTTHDIDICCDFSQENLLRLESALLDIHPVHCETTDRQPLKLNEMIGSTIEILQLETDLGQLNCTRTVTGLGDFKTVAGQSKTIELDEHPCRILSIEALIAAKKAQGRPKDIETIKQLEVIRQMQKRPEDETS